MEMSFFAACPLTEGLSVSFDFAQDHEPVEWPRKSGHTRNADLTIV
jgi:hypothetical protein